MQLYLGQLNCKTAVKIRLACSSSKKLQPMWSCSYVFRLSCKIELSVDATVLVCTAEYKQYKPNNTNYKYLHDSRTNTTTPILSLRRTPLQSPTPSRHTISISSLAIRSATLAILSSTRAILSARLSQYCRLFFRAHEMSPPRFIYQSCRRF
jgi:hypothetical protein